MPIRGRSLGETARSFVDHLNRVLHTTVSQASLALVVVEGVANISFRSGVQPVAPQLRTGYGPMELYVGQLCDSVVGQDRLHTLRTVSYRYALTPVGNAEPLLRWEYVKFPGVSKLYCRHHFQGPIRLDLGRSGEQVVLNDWHLPTGWVTIEEVLRFCIVDLGITPLSEDWD
ncbi:MAG: hypothetical protein M3P51_11080, partial [Chloroflexota bacterium]|nr:hypothetical protein [Chloroflexota bacterium]